MYAQAIGKFIGVLLILVFWVGVGIAISDEALRIYRGWNNKDGTEVEGYGLVSLSKINEIL
jgi:hypothetical protein